MAETLEFFWSSSGDYTPKNWPAAENFARQEPSYDGGDANRVLAACTKYFCSLSEFRGGNRKLALA
jgi:hypothetical protein